MRLHIRRFTTQYVILFTMTLAILAVSSAYGATEHVIYVSPGGRVDGDGSRESPAATIEGAQKIVRNLLKKEKRPVRVVIADGVYRITKPVVFTPEDSGTKEAPIIYTAADGANPVISGGLPLPAPVKPEPEKKWKLTIPAVKSGKLYFRQLFINGKRYTRARRPNKKDYWFHIKRQLKPRDAAIAIYNGGDIRKWKKFREIELVALRIWNTSRFNLKSIDTKKRIVTCHTGEKFPSMRRWNYDKRYYLENSLSFLDEDGEWYLDKQSGVLHVKPFGEHKQDFARADIVVPVIQKLMLIQGTADKPISHLAFKGITFSHTTWSFPKEGFNGHQTDWIIGAAIEADYAQNVRFDSCRFTKLGRYGLWFRQGCRQNDITDCEFADLAGGGVMIGTTERYSKPDDRTSHNNITNNHIHHIGEVWHGSVGIWVCYASYNNIISNHLHDTSYSGISVGWGWADAASDCHHNKIEKNRIHDGLLIMGDGSGIYTLGQMPGTTIRSNMIYDTFGWRCWGSGIYCDEGSSDIVIENNFLARTYGHSLCLHKANRNKIRNNMFILAGIDVVHAGGAKDNIIENNIFYYVDKGIYSNRWKPDFASKDKNIYFRPDKDPLVFPKNYTFKEWQEKGYDVNSLVADPKFKDPYNGDFRLKPDSPALKLGFKPFDIPLIGPRKRDWRKSDEMSRLFRLERGKQGTAIKRTNIPKLTAALVGRIRLDGRIDENEWPGAAVELITTTKGDDTESGKSLLRIASDKNNLYVSIVTLIEDPTELKADGKTWGTHDGFEVSFQKANDRKAPIFIARGYASGSYRISDEAAAPAKAISRLRMAARFKAVVEKTQWSGEWRLPLHACGIDPRKDKLLNFNVTVRRARKRIWVPWVDTGGASWELDKAGQLVLR